MVNLLLYVKTPDEALNIINSIFKSCTVPVEHVCICYAMGRTLGEDVIAREYVPDFNRSAVDGYAVFARDTFGCSDSIPAIVPLAGEIRRGDAIALQLTGETCVSVPWHRDEAWQADNIGSRQ